MIKIAKKKKARKAVRTYYCNKCHYTHYADSDVGKKHRKSSNIGR